MKALFMMSTLSKKQARKQKNNIQYTKPVEAKGQEKINNKNPKNILNFQELLLN